MVTGPKAHAFHTIYPGDVLSIWCVTSKPFRFILPYTLVDILGIVLIYCKTQEFLDVPLEQNCRSTKTCDGNYVTGFVCNVTDHHEYIIHPGYPRFH